jgi:hypothetical protein
VVCDGEIEVWAVGAGGYGEDDGDGALPECGERAGGFAAGVGSAAGFVAEWVRVLRTAAWGGVEEAE